MIGFLGIGKHHRVRGLLSAYDAQRLARALAEKDVNAIKQVSGVGKKTAERLAEMTVAEKAQAATKRKTRRQGQR